MTEPEGAIARQIRLHQQTIDTDFPHGAVASWVNRDTVYNISWIQVTGMSGLDPIVTLYVFGADRVLEDMVVTSWETVQESPLIIKATFAGEDSPMRFVADVPQRLAVLMDAARQQLIAVNPLPAGAV